MSVNGLRMPSRGRLISTPEYRAWQEEQLWLLASQKEPKLKGAYALHLMLNKPDNRRRDISNYIKSAEDLLVSAKFVEDDSYCQKLTVEWVRGQDSPAKAFLVNTWER